MKNNQADRREFMRWAGAGQTLLLERDKKGTVYVLPHDGGLHERKMLDIVAALDRGETVELVNCVTGRVLSTLELTRDGYVERLAEGVPAHKLNY